MTRRRTPAEGSASPRRVLGAPDIVTSHSQGAAGIRRAVLIAALALVVLLLGLSEVSRLGQGPVAAGLVVIQSVPLLWCRSRPWQVLVLTTAGHVGQMLLGLPASNAALGHWVAVTAVVAVVRWPWSTLPPLTVFAVDTVLAFTTPGGSGLRDALLLAGLALVSWALGDATFRRSQVHERLRQDSRARAVGRTLQARSRALAERLHMGEETSRLVGEALDRIVLQVRAARPLLGTPAVTGHLSTVEEQCRAALGELDRYLALLRRPLGQPEPPVESRPFDGSRLAGRAPRWAAPFVARAAVVLPTVLILTLGVWEAVAVVGTERLPVSLLWLPVLQSVPLVVRHRHPLPVLLVVTAAVCGQPLLGYPVFNASLAIPVAAHALAERGPRRRVVLTTTACVLAVVAVVLTRDAAAALQVLLVLGALSGVACYVGDAARLARDDDARLVARLAAFERDEAMRTAARIDADRVAMARDLHDGLGHTLAVVVIHAGAARMAPADDVAARSAALDAIERCALDAFADLDTSAPIRTRPDPVGAASVRDVPRLVETVRATGLVIALDIDPAAEALPPTLQSGIYRIVQEALTNAAKHAPGSRVTVTVRCGDGVTVRVHNTAPAAPAGRMPPSGGRGLTGMRERVSLFDGTVSVGPDASGGYTVQATLPVR